MKRLSLILTLLLFTLGVAMAQRTVKGMVTDDRGEPLIGASILVKSTSSGTVTGIDGSYSVTVPEGGNTLVVSYTGYETLEVAIGASSTIDIKLSEGISLNEVVVTALGVSRNARETVYANQTVGADDLLSVTNKNTLEALRGKTAGEHGVGFCWGFYTYRFAR